MLLFALSGSTVISARFPWISQKNLPFSPNTANLLSSTSVVLK